MLLGRKKKQKKAKKLLEAQLAAAQHAEQQQQLTDSVSLGGNLAGLPSVSTEKLYNIEETSSDEGMETVSLAALSEVHSPTSVLQQKISPATTLQPPHHGSKTALNDTSYYIQPQINAYPKITTPIATISPQPLPMSTTPFINSSATNGTLPAGTVAASHLFNRAHSQPLIPATQIPPSSVAVTDQQMLYAQQLHQQQLMGRTSSNGGTLKRNKKVVPEVISPEKQELITSALSFGLGRGIDATDKKPWMNKKPFQIRRVHTSIVETSEGGILMNYNNEVQSVAETEEKFLASLKPPESAVTIHIEDELDRNFSSSRHIVGRKVVNQSIGFQADFEEKYKDGEKMKSAKGVESSMIPKDPAEVISNTQKSGYTFEERLSEWILHRLVHKRDITVHKKDDNPVDQLATLIRSKTILNIEEEITAGCMELIRDLRVTHYITGLQLGAAEYRVMSDGQYHKKIASEGAFGVDSLASAFSKSKIKLTKKEATKCSQLRQLGKIEDNNVAKNSSNEVVLQVQAQPITRLIKLPTLKSALKSAIEQYMQGTPSSEGGPFVIKCTGRNLYLTVNKFNNYEVEATDIPTEASLFYFQTTDDGGNPFEFHIAYYGEDTAADPSDEVCEGSMIGRYLEAPLSAQGRCPGPLLMKHSVKVKNTRFTLRSRLSKKNSKSHLAEWIAGEDAFYVACATKKYQHGSYLAVKAVSKTSDFIGKYLYMTCCDPSIHNHNGDNAFMLFQLTTREAVLSNKSQSGRATPNKLSVKKTSVVNNTAEIETRNGPSTPIAVQ